MSVFAHQDLRANDVQLLDPEGHRREHPDYAFHGSDELIASWYRDLFLVRRFDTESHALQRHGELGLWAPCRGQEAAQVGSAHALAEQDYAFPTYRDHGVTWVRGIDPVTSLKLFRGTELGGWNPADHNIALPAIIIGAQTLHATGYAMGLNFEGKIGHADPNRDGAVIAYLGDGATSQGDVNEAFVYAASFNAPVVFFVQNNHWAISVPTERQSKIPLVERARGFGFNGIRVDGNDILATYAVTQQALQNARDGNGPTLIEAMTYRMGAHTTSDDPTRYRDANELELWEKRDPILRVRKYLESVGYDESFFAPIEKEADELGERLRSACKNLPDPDLGELFEFVTETKDPELIRQHREFVAMKAGAR